MGELFRQLKEKHLFRTAVVYAGGAWLMLEATGFFVDTYALSRHIIDVVVLLAVLGFPAALIISWFHGEKGRQDVARSEAALLLVLAVLAAVGTYRITTASEVTANRSGGAAAPSSVRTASEDLGARSIAVIPFTNATGLDSLDWIGSGVSDMLTTSLARSGDMRVVSPQRLFELLRAAGRQETDVIPDDVAMQVAGDAGAHRMVRGSVLGTLEDLVLDVQLIDLSDGTVVAGDRLRGDDVFTMSDSLAAWVSGAMYEERPPQLADAGFPPTRPPLALSGNPEKLKEYSIALRNAWSEDNVDANYRVVDLLDDWSGREGEVRSALERIVKVDPNDVRALRGLVRVAAEQEDTAGLDTLIRRYEAVETDPGRARMTVARAYERVGEMDRAREEYRGMIRDGIGGHAPLDRIVRTYLDQHEPKKARDELKRLGGNHEDLAARVELLTADTYAWEGNFEAAMQGYQRAEDIGAAATRAAALESALSIRWVRDPSDGASRINGSVWTLLDLGRDHEALNVIEGAEHLYVGDTDRLPPVDVHVLLYARGRALELAGANKAAATAYRELLQDWGDVVDQLPLLADAPQRLQKVAAG
ncbi:MAG: CsgG/HfaB family protein [Gemmatimonadales bacterium]|jgi:TolB-like protein/tetratricopeptide (TPR) repeat protein